MKTLVPIANGTEEMEAVIIIDTLRRAEFDVTVVGLSAGTIEASRGVKLVPDTTWEQVHPDDFDILLLVEHAGNGYYDSDAARDAKWDAIEKEMVSAMGGADKRKAFTEGLDQIRSYNGEKYMREMIPK